MKMKQAMSGWIVLTLLLLGLVAGAGVASASVEVDVGFFYDRLSLYGHWVQHPQHGWVWYPRTVPVGWRPYTYGHWVLTDDYGWMWVSDWEWGWGPFHYGCWAFDDEYGWVWVPGTVWGPAWVAWRTGGGFIGWAPLPPDVVWEVDVGFRFRRADWDIVIGRPGWSFVEEGAFLSPRLREHIALAARNVTIIEKTKNVTNYVFVNKRIVNQSISVQRIEQVTKATVQRVKVRDVDSVASARLSRTGPDEISVFRPTVKPVQPGRLPPQTLDQLHEVERAEIQERHTAEQDTLEERHRQEQSVPGASPEQLRQQHEDEMRALQDQHEREQRILERQQQSERRTHERRR